MNKEPERIIEFKRLNLFGKAVYTGGAVVRLAAHAIDTTIDKVADVYAEAERAFREGADPNVDDARIIEERVEPSRKSTHRSR